jgi:hypothetical protein
MDWGDRRNFAFAKYLFPISRNYFFVAKFGIAKIYYDISRNICDEIKFLPGRETIFEFPCMSIPLKRNLLFAKNP